MEQGDAPDGAPEITLVSAKDGHTGRFPDIARLRDGRLMAVFYWNNTHAPYDCADSVGTICAVIGSPDGLSWEADRRVLVDEVFLSGYGLGVWMDAEGRFYYDKAEAQTANARFCVDVRDPNLCAMRDGTLALTYFTRVPVTAKIGGHRLYNEGRDYTTGRSYLLTSADDGLTWSAPVEIPCSYLDLSCAKRGNICQYSDGSCLIPLYGKSSQCVKLNRRFQKIYPDTTACVLAKRNDDGTWSFLEEYNSRSLAFGLIRSPGVFRAKNNEVSLIADERDCTFALCRPSGDILRSEDKGQSWKLIGENAKSPQVSVQQPGFCAIPNSDDVFVTWSETISPGNRTVFARVYHMKSA